MFSCLNIHKGKPKEAEPHVGVEVALPNIVGMILLCKDEQAVPAIVWYPRSVGCQVQELNWCSVWLA